MKPIKFLRVITFISLLGLCLIPTDPVSAAGRVFYDGFESGNTNLWYQVDGRNKCQAVQSPGDGGPSPQSGSYQTRCNYNGTLIWYEPARFETMGVSPSIGNEFFLRKYIRISPNLESTGAGGDNTGPKLMRSLNSGGYSAYLGLDSVNPGTIPADISWIHETPGEAQTAWYIAALGRTSWSKF